MSEERRPGRCKLVWDKEQQRIVKTLTDDAPAEYRFTAEELIEFLFWNKMHSPYLMYRAVFGDGLHIRYGSELVIENGTPDQCAAFLVDEWRKSR